MDELRYDNATLWRGVEGPRPLIFSWIAGNLTTTISTAITVTLVSVFFYVKNYREAFIKRFAPLKRLKGNKWMGTLPAMVDIYKISPRDTHPQATITMLYRKNKLDNVFFMDMWPAASEPHLIIGDPDVAAQVTQAKSLPKHPIQRPYVEHVTGSQSIILTEGEVWKRARTVFNPGFALSHLMTLVPSIVDDALVFRSILVKLAQSGEVSQLEDPAAKFAFDIMGHLVLDHDLNSQTGKNELVESFRESMKWSPSPDNLNPFHNHNPIAAILHKYYAWKMDRYLGRILNERYKTKSSDQIVEKKTRSRRKPAIDLALDEYARLEAEEGRKVSNGLDPAFKALAIDQMKSFLFAGHDTSSTMICFCYHLLSKNPERAKKMRAEHDEVFGKDPSKAAEVLKEDPNLINKLPYTIGVIKETLRLFPPASTVRKGTPDINITYNGHTYETEGMMVWVVSHLIHRRGDLFPDPDAFIPERFLPPEHPDRFQEVPKDAWRPFEKGPRNCIGQELAYLEIKIALVLTCREFEVEEAYEYWDRKMGREKPGDQLDGKRGLFGDRAYQILQSSAKPIDGFPATVKRRVVHGN